MSNQYGQSDADPAGNQPTQQFWASPDAPAPPAWGGQPGLGAHGGPGAQEGTAHHLPGLQEHLAKDRRKALHWTAGLLAAALLAGGGMVAGLKLAGHSSPAAASGTFAAGALAGGTGPGASGQAALLGQTLSNAAAPGPLTTAAGSASPGGGTGAPAANAPACARGAHVSRVARRAGLPRVASRIGIGAARCRLARHRVFAFFLLRGVDGQFTVQTRQGTKTLAFERGVITSVTAGKSIVVKASDGTTWTWNLVSTTIVRDRQGKVSPSSLTSGTPVWVGGPVVSGAKDARLIVVRPPQLAPVPPSSTPGS